MHVPRRAGMSSAESTPAAPALAPPKVAGGGTWIGGAIKHGGAHHAPAPAQVLVRWAADAAFAQSACAGCFGSSCAPLALLSQHCAQRAPACHVT